MLLRRKKKNKNISRTINNAVTPVTLLYCQGKKDILACMCVFVFMKACVSTVSIRGHLVTLYTHHIGVYEWCLGSWELWSEKKTIDVFGV